MVIVSQPPLRAVILDNDETTGCYSILFGLLAGIQSCLEIPIWEVPEALERLADWMIAHNAFRPGLRVLLRTLVSLKQRGHLDAVIMQTNQKAASDDCLEQAIEGQLLQSPPKAVEYMLSQLAQTPDLFDVIFARPQKTQQISQNGIIHKSFGRVLDFYPERPRDISRMIFVDDIAQPQQISAEGVPLSKRNKYSYYPVEPQTRKFSSKEVFQCVAAIFPGRHLSRNFWTAFANTQNTLGRKSNSAPNANIFLQLCNVLQREQGSIPKKSEPLYLNMSLLKLNRNVAGDPREESQADSGATDRKCDDSEKTTGSGNPRFGCFLEGIESPV